MTAKYDTIGINYNQTRKADPFLAERLIAHLQPHQQGTYLDIGCGTGNYTNALQQKGFRFIGIDPSEQMLDKARKLNAGITWKKGTVAHTGLDTESMDGIIATLTIHHWPNLEEGFAELYRILRPGGYIVVFTSAPEQTGNYWLNHYFPKMMKESVDQLPSMEKVSRAMNSAGFSIDYTENYDIHPELEDLFLYCGKYQPERYFQPEIRNGISSFSSLANAGEVKSGLEKLETDMNSGKIHDIIKQYENNLGDYVYIVGNKS